MNESQEQLRAVGLRVTRQRSEVLATVQRLRHATPERVYEELSGGIDQSTVYRCLETLASVGLITHTHIGHGPPVYHPVDPTAHIHLVCQSCGRQTSADIAQADALVASLLAEQGFAADLAYLSLPGTCAECRAETK